MLSLFARLVRYIKGFLLTIFDAVADFSDNMPGMAKTFERTLIKDFMYGSLSFAGPGTSPAYVSAQLDLRPGFLSSPRKFREALDEFIGFVPRDQR